MNENMNNELNNELETVTDFAEVKPAEETAVVETQDNEVKSLGKDLAEMAIVGVVIYAFCKLCDFLIDKIKAGVKKFKAKRAEKKAQKAAQAQQQAPAQQGPVANVEKPAEGTETTQQ